MPVGRFEYNPGVSDQRASIFANSNQMFGQVLMGVLSGMAKQKEIKANKLEALTHDAKSAEGAFNADRTTVGDDPNGMQGVLARWNVASPQEWKTLSAQDKVARRDGVIGAEQLLSLAQQRKRQSTDDAGAALVPRVLKLTSDLQAAQPAVDEAGNPVPSQPTTKLLMRAMGMLSPAEQKTFGQSSAGLRLLQGAMTAGERDDTALARENMITQRASDREAQITQRAATREEGLNKRHEDNFTLANQKLESLNQLRAQKGKVSPDTMYKAMEGTKRALIAAQTSAQMMGKTDQAKAIEDKLTELEAQQSALTQGGTGASADPGTVPTISTQAAYDALAPGMKYIDSTGKTKTKQKIN